MGNSANGRSIFLTCVITCFVALFAVCGTAFADDYADGGGGSIATQSTGDFANVVIVARFADDTTESYNVENQYNTSYTEYDRFRARFDQAEGFFGQTYSLSKFVSDISDGQSIIKNYFPQASGDGHTTAYVTLLKTQEQYQDEPNPEFTLVTDVIDAFDKQYSGSTAGWDADGDGSIDNLDIIVQVNETIPVDNQMLWPHKYNLGQPSGHSIGGLNVNIYNVVNSLAVDEGATVAHEFLHSMDLRDLYRLGALTTEKGFEGANTPVGIWDIMAKAGFEFPLAQSRQDLGWGSIPEVTESGSYTLSAVGTTDGRNAIKVASPFSSDEYFVFEYRQKPPEAEAMTSPDKYIPNSGLIAYRVNNSFGQKSNKTYDSSGNYYRDYLYVFRPGETGLHSSAGNTMESCLSVGEKYAPLNGLTQHDSFGTANASDPISAGTICDSAGRNSLIQVKVTAQDDGSVTFDLTLGDTSDLDTWDQVGSFATSGRGFQAITAGDDGTAYVVAQSSNSADYNVTAYHSDGTTTAMGTAFNANAGGVPLLAYNNGTLYCALPKYPGTNNSVEVKKYEGGTWKSVGSVNTGDAYANVPTLAAVDGHVYLAVDSDNEQVQLYDVTTTVAKVGNTFSGAYIQGMSLGVLDGKVVVAYGNYNMNDASDRTMQVKQLVNGTWQPLATLPQVTRITKLASAADDTLVLLQRGDDAKPAVYTLTSAGLSAPAVIEDTGTAADSGIELQVRDGWAYVMVDQHDSTLAVDVARVWAAQTDDLSSWQKVGEDAAQPASNAAFAASEGMLYVVSENSDTGNATVASHAALEAVTPPTPPVVETTLTDSDVNATTDFVYDGSAHKYVPVVTVDGKTLAEGTDYSVAYSTTDFTAANNAITATITGTGSYQGQVQRTYKIAKKPVTVSADAKSKVKGAADPKLTATVKGALNGDTIAYTLTRAAGENAGTYTITASGAAEQGNYAVSFKAGTFTITQPASAITLGSGNVSQPSNVAYNGKAQQPAVRVTYGGITLRSGVDYSIQYWNNTNPGTASVVVQGKGAYAGTVTKTFSITTIYAKKTLNSGAYTINTKLGATRLVDISGRSTANGGNAQMYVGNETPAQRFYLQWQEVAGGYGYYTLKNVYSGKYLDAAAGKADNGTNVQQYQGNGTAAQRWILTEDNGYYKLRNAGGNKVLDISGNNPANGANLQLWTSNDTSAQRFRFNTCLRSEIAVGKTNLYTFRNVANSQRVVDVSGASKGNSANIQLYNGNNTNAQKFYFVYEASTGYYIIYNVNSDKVIDVAGAGEANGSNIQQYQANGTYAQKWSLKKVGSTYTMFCACNGRCFDLNGANTSNGTNIHCWDSNGTNAQKWTLQRVSR